MGQLRARLEREGDALQDPELRALVKAWRERKRAQALWISLSPAGEQVELWEVEFLELLRPQTSGWGVSRRLRAWNSAMVDSLTLLEQRALEAQWTDEWRRPG